MKFNGANFEPYIAIEGPGAQRLAAKPKTREPVIDANTSDYEAAMKEMRKPEFDHVFALLDLLEEPAYMSGRLLDILGHYSTREHAFINRDGSRVPLATLQAAVDARIQELDLDRDLIEEWMSPRYFPAAEEQRWRRQSFEQRIQTFRRGVAK